MNPRPKILRCWQCEKVALSLREYCAWHQATSLELQNIRENVSEREAYKELAREQVKEWRSKSPRRRTKSEKQLDAEKAYANILDGIRSRRALRSAQKALLAS